MKEISVFESYLVKDHDDFPSVTYNRIRNILPSDLLPEALDKAFEEFEAREKKRVELGDGHGNRTEPGDEQFREDAKLVHPIIPAIEAFGIHHRNSHMEEPSQRSIAKYKALD